MSENDSRCSPMQYVVENATNFRVLDFITYFDFDTVEDAKAVLKSSLNNALTLSKIKKSTNKVNQIKNLKENIDEVCEFTLKVCFNNFLIILTLPAGI